MLRSLPAKVDRPAQGQICISGDFSPYLKFQYNPETVTESLEIKPINTPKPSNQQAKGKTGKKGGVAASAQHTNMAPFSVTISDLMFDRYEDGGDVKKEVVDKLMALLGLDPDTLKLDSFALAGRQPLVDLYLGTVPYPQLFLQSCKAQYTLFHPDLTPARAKVTLKFLDAKNQAGQNPTSGGMGGETSYVVQPGDTLEGISFRELGDPTRWRALAAANGIENPLDLKPGRRLFIPAL